MLSKRKYYFTLLRYVTLYYHRQTFIMFKDMDYQYSEHKNVKNSFKQDYMFNLMGSIML